MNKNLDISVIIPAYNEEKLIKKCIDSIKRQNTKLHYEIIVVNNNSTDKTKDIAKKQKIKVVDEKIQGVGAARKTGTNHAKGEIIIHIDADTILPSNHFEKVWFHFKKDKNLVCLGGQFVFYDAHFLKNLIRPFFYITLLYFAKIASKGTLGPMGNNMALRHNAYKKTKGFSENLKFGEDMDICRKIKRLGKIKTDLSLKVGVSVRRFKFNRKLFLYTVNFFASCIQKKPYKNILVETTA